MHALGGIQIPALNKIAAESSGYNPLNVENVKDGVTSLYQSLFFILISFLIATNTHIHTWKNDLFIF